MMRHVYQRARALMPWVGSPADLVPISIPTVLGIVWWLHGDAAAVVPVLAYQILLCTTSWAIWKVDQWRGRRDQHDPGGDQDDDDDQDDDNHPGHDQPPEDPDGPSGAAIRARLAEWRNSPVLAVDAT